jgi:hypothetical protein
MPSVELIYDSDCPNVAAARERLLRAFDLAKLAPDWREWERSDADSPLHVRRHGSPTILVDGKDVGGILEGGGEGCCRVYPDEAGVLRPAPSERQIADALNRAAGPEPVKAGGRWIGFGTLLPAVAAALLPKLTCPACWPAYAALLGALGIGFVNYTPYLLPATGLFVAFALGVLAYGAKARRGYGPLWLGMAGGVGILVGKFWFESDPALFAGIGLLAGASLWNAWPRGPGGACAACSPGGSAAPGRSDFS